jgi:hypothetical protein
MLLALPSSLLLLALPLDPSSLPILLFFLSMYRSYSSLALEVDRRSSIHSHSYYASCSSLFPSSPGSPSGSLFSPYPSLLSFYVSLLIISCARCRSSISYTLSLLLCFLLSPLLFYSYILLSLFNFFCPMLSTSVFSCKFYSFYCPPSPLPDIILPL